MIKPKTKSKETHKGRAATARANREPDTGAVFVALGLARQEDRLRFRQLSEVGRSHEMAHVREPSRERTNNNTTRSTDDAELEPTPR